MLYILGLPVLLIAGTLLLTLIVEFPIVYCTGITRDKKFIVAVNALTNVCLNVVIVLLAFLTLTDLNLHFTRSINIWTLTAEVLFIPVAEFILYLKVSKESKVKVVIVTYIANFASFLIGLFAVGLLRWEGIHGISNFFKGVFGGGY